MGCFGSCKVLRIQKKNSCYYPNNYLTPNFRAGLHQRFYRLGRLNAAVFVAQVLHNLIGVLWLSFGSRTTHIDKFLVVLVEHVNF